MDFVFQHALQTSIHSQMAHADVNQTAHHVLPHRLLSARAVLTKQISFTTAVALHLARLTP
jgi:hypothetical protein